MKNISGLCNIQKLHNRGNHLALDGYTSSKKILNNEKFIKKFLIDLVNEISMRAISKPLVIKYDTGYKDKTQNGITGTIILAESNITIHTYPEYNFFCLDIFSCKEFPIEKTITYLTKKLQITKHKKQILKRGFYNGKD